MENPNSWSELERVIDRAIRNAVDDMLEGRAGFSTPMMIGNALREAGLVVDDERTRHNIHPQAR